MKRFTLAVLTLGLFTALAFAQGTSGRLAGTVAGPDGNIPGATIVAKDDQTGREVTVKSSDDGSFSIPRLEFGTYTVTITAPGFKTFSSTNLKIDTGRDYTLNATLEIGNISETVQVVAGADVINGSTGELSNSVSPRQVKELPINGRNPLALLNLIAGSNPTSSSINGQRSSSVNYTRDGLNVQDNFIRNGFVSDVPTVDDTGEFTVITQNAGAEYGTGSTQVILVTPRGGSEFHGNIFEFHRNARFAANNFFNNANRVPRSALKRDQFGGTLSGPAPLPRFGEGGMSTYRNKGFFFFNYEAFRLTNQVAVNTTTLLPAARTGNFTYVDNSNVQRTVNVLTGAGFATALSAAQGGVLAIDPLIQSRILDQMPTAGNGQLTGINFLQALAIQRGNPETRNAVTGRFDVELNDTNSFNFVYKWNKNADARTDIASGFSSEVFNTQGGPTTLYVGAYQMNPTPSFANEIRGGYQRSEPFFLSTTNPRTLPFLLSLPLVTNPEPSFQSQGRNTDYWNLQDNASYTFGNHALRFGGQIQLYRIEAINDVGITPTYAITGVTTAAPGLVNANFPGGINTTDLGRANSLRFLLGGVIGSGGQTLNATSSTSGFVRDATQIRRFKFNNYAGYLADQWRVSPQLTVNLGLRYEFYTPLNNPDGVYLEPVVPAGVDPIAAILNPIGNFQPVGANSGSKGSFSRPDKDNWGPNISFAYSPSFKNRLLGSLFPGEGRTVIRGGYRVNYVNDEYVRSQDNANLNNTGLGSFAASARLGGTATGSTQFRIIGVGNAPSQAPIFVPVSAFGPGGSGTRTFLENNLAAGGGGGGGLGGTISLVDPNFQVQRNYEYNFGIQREVGFQSVIEVRYVGGYSKELVRSIDLNQLEIRSNGFLADFQRAERNLALVEARRAQIVASGLTGAALTAALAPFPLTAAPNAQLAGSQTLTVFPNLGGGGFLADSTVLNAIRTGVPGSLAEIYVINGLTGTVPILNNPNAGVVNFTTNGGRYNYNSLQAEFRRRFMNGLSLQANYTWQKILTDVTGSTDEVNQTRVEPYLDNADPTRDYARAIYDRAHTFNFNGIYELPFGRGKRFLSDSGWADRIFGGFQITSIVNISSGVPVSITDGRGTLNRAGRSGTQPATSSLTADQIQDLFGTFRTPNGVFIINPSVLFATATAPGQPTLSGFDLTQQLPPGYTIASIRGANPVGTAPFANQVFFPNRSGSTGNLQRNFINGPIYINWDAGLHKNIRITENTRLQLRAEAFNVLNRANFFTGNLDVGSTSFGRISAAGNAYAARLMQFGARFEF